MPVNLIKAGVTTQAANSPASPAQTVNKQIASDAALVKKLFAPSFARRLREMVSNQADGRPQPMLLAHERMARRSVANWSERAGNATINRSNISQVARNELNAFSRNSASYTNVLRRAESAIFTQERQAALTAIQTFEKSVRQYKGGATGYPSRASADRAIATFGSNWKYSPNLKAETANQKRSMNTRLTIAMQPTKNGTLMRSDPAWKFDSISFRRPDGTYSTSRDFVKPGTIQRIKLSFSHPRFGNHEYNYSTLYPPKQNLLLNISFKEDYNENLHKFGFMLTPSLIATMDSYGWTSTCFKAGTMVTMSDGTRRAIETLVAGDVVMGRDGMRNTVQAPKPAQLAGRKLYGFNGGTAFVTVDHPFMLATGQWAAISREAILKGMPDFEQDYGPIRDLATGDVIVREGGGTFVIETIDEHAAPEQTVYNMTLDGNRTYFADGFLVHNR